MYIHTLDTIWILSGISLCLAFLLGCMAWKMYRKPSGGGLGFTLAIAGTLFSAVSGILPIYRIIEGTAHEMVLFSPMGTESFCQAAFLLSALVAACMMIPIVSLENRGVCLWKKAGLIKKLPMLAAYSAAFFSAGTMLYLLGLGIFLPI